VETASRSFAVRRHRITFKNPGVTWRRAGGRDRWSPRPPQPSSCQSRRRPVGCRHRAARRQAFHREGDEPVKILPSGSRSRHDLEACCGRRSAAGGRPGPWLGPGGRDEMVRNPHLWTARLALADAGFLVVPTTSGDGAERRPIRIGHPQRLREDARAIVAFLENARTWTRSASRSSDTARARGHRWLRPLETSALRVSPPSQDPALRASSCSAAAASAVSDQPPEAEQKHASICR